MARWSQERRCWLRHAPGPGIIAPGPVRTTIWRMNCKTAGLSFRASGSESRNRDRPG